MLKTRCMTAAVPAAILMLGACGGDSPTASPPPELNCTGGAPLAVGASVNGTLEEGDDRDVDNAFLDRYALTMEEDGTIEMTMRSSEVDSFLWLLETNGDVIAFDDDSGGGENGLDAQLVHALDRGCYLAEATTFPEESGAYTLTVGTR